MQTQINVYRHCVTVFAAGGSHSFVYQGADGNAEFGGDAEKQREILVTHVRRYTEHDTIDALTELLPDLLELATDEIR